MSGTLHVSPIGDLIDHVMDLEGACPCGPTTEAVFDRDGAAGWMIVHHSLDGREQPSPELIEEMEK